MSGTKRLFSSLIKEDDTYQRKSKEEDNNIKILKEKFKRPRLDEIRLIINNRYGSNPDALSASSNPGSDDNSDSLSVFNNIGESYDPAAFSTSISVNTDTPTSNITQNEPDFTVVGILEYNEIHPISYPTMRNHTVTHRYPSHIVIEITGHGKVVERPSMYDNTERNTNVSIFSLASYGNSIQSCQLIDDDNRDEIRGAIQKNYPIFQSFIAFRDHLLHPHSWKIDGMRNGENDEDYRHSTAAMKRGEYAYCHHFTEHMLYESDAYNEQINPTFPLSVYIYDVRYPTTAIQEDLLQYSLEEFMEMLFIDGIATKQTTDDNKTIDSLLLSKLVEYLKIVLGFQYVTIFESACREDETLNLSITQKRNNFNSQYKVFNNWMKNNPELLLYGGRKRRTRKIRIKRRTLRKQNKKRRTRK